MPPALFGPGHPRRMPCMTPVLLDSPAQELSMNFKPLCVIACALLPIMGCAGVPKELDVEGPRVATVHATGYQVYTWDSAWKLKAPDATFTGGITGKHYVGPTWECTSDGSKV